jgi:hypothetical protein
VTELARLLADAEGLLQGDLSVGKTHSIRAACWVARSALEVVVSDLLAQRSYSPGDASMRSRLSCLEVAYADRPALVLTAEYAWSGLSNACHHHAFQLSPSLAEARHLVGLVGQLADECSVGRAAKASVGRSTLGADVGETGGGEHGAGRTGVGVAPSGPAP